MKNEILQQLEKLYGKKDSRDQFGRRPATPNEIQRVVERPQVVPPVRKPEALKKHIKRDGK